jgi:hypothetical protein
MRERRWESISTLQFGEILSLGERLARRGLSPANPAKDVICYIEEWAVKAADDFDRLDPWPTEDVTLVHIRENWQGDFFLLTGAYHTIYQRYQTVGTYCSVSHPWRIGETLTAHLPRAMFWIGFRHTHGFIRIRLHTTEVVAPGETRFDAVRPLWLEERRRCFDHAVKLLDLPIEVVLETGSVTLRCNSRKSAFFCSWPDAFGPCQFEFNTSDPFEFLVPASKLASTHGGQPTTVRAYLTGFGETALEEFGDISGPVGLAYRCSVHCPLDEIPEILDAIRPEGRLYVSLCEFQTQQVLPQGEDASAIVGVMGMDGGFKVEVRLNRAPLPESLMDDWLTALLGLPLVYVPLPPFP